jgi:hypothetical protein
MRTIILLALAISLCGCTTVNCTVNLPVGAAPTSSLAININANKNVPVTPSVTIPAQTLAGALTGGAAGAIDALVGK